MGPGLQLRRWKHAGGQETEAAGQRVSQDLPAARVRPARVGCCGLWKVRPRPGQDQHPCIYQTCICWPDTQDSQEAASSPEMRLAFWLVLSIENKTAQRSALQVHGGTEDHHDWGLADVADVQLAGVPAGACDRPWLLYNLGQGQHHSHRELQGPRVGGGPSHPQAVLVSPTAVTRHQKGSVVLLHQIQVWQSMANRTLWSSTDWLLHSRTNCSRACSGPLQYSDCIPNARQ